MENILLKGIAESQDFKTALVAIGFMLDVVLEIESNHFNEQFENTLVKMISSMKITPEQFIKTLDMIDPGMAGELDGFLEGVK